MGARVALLWPCAMSHPGALPRVRKEEDVLAEQRAYNEHEEARRRRMGSGKPNWALLSPLAFAFLPVVGLVFRKQPVLRNRLFFIGCGFGVLHAVFLLS